jgi:hypothetical protein
MTFLKLRLSKENKFSVMAEEGLGGINVRSERDVSEEGIFEKADKFLSELGRWYVLSLCVG